MTRDLKNKAEASFKAGNTESAVLQNLQLGGLDHGERLEK